MDSGEVATTVSTKDRVAGALAFVAFRFCSAEILPCVRPAQRPSNAVGIEVRGSFEATPFDPTAVSIRLGANRRCK